MPEPESVSAEATKPRGGGGLKRRLGELSVGNTILTTVVAVVGVVIAIGQARLATAENQASDRQSLASLTIDLANQERAAATASGDVVAYIHQATAADAAQGVALVNALHGHVPTVVSFELGTAFAQVGNYHQALLSYTQAGGPGDNPFYRSKALRAAASILYYLGGRSDDVTARSDTVRAYHALDGQPYVPAFQRDQYHELVLLWDAFWSADVGCGRARNELTHAKALIASDPSSEDHAISDYLAEATAAVNACTRGKQIAHGPPAPPLD